MGKVGLRFNAGVEYQGRIYASAVGINGLFEVDLETGNTAYVKSFTKEKVRHPIHRCAFLYGKEAWFIPQNGRYISIVDLETMEIEYVEPLYRRRDENPDPSFATAYCCGDIAEGKYLYLVPGNVDALLLIDMEQKKVYPYYDVAEEGNFICGGYEDGHIFLFPFTGKKILEINLRTDERKWHPWRYPSEVYGEAVRYGDRYWFSPYACDNILAVDVRGERAERISLGELYDGRCQYHYMARYGKQLFLIPLRADRILRLDMEAGKLSGIFLEGEALDAGRTGFQRIDSENSLILASAKKHMILIYDRVRDNFRTIKLSIDLSAGMREIENLWDIGSSLAEGDVGLENYIGIVSERDRSRNEAGTAGALGTDIWNAAAAAGGI